MPAEKKEIIIIEEKIKKKYAWFNMNWPILGSNKDKVKIEPTKEGK